MVLRLWKPLARLVSEAGEVHEFGGLAVGFFDPFDDFFGLRRVFELDGDDAIDGEFFDRVKVREKFDDATAGREVAVDLAVAIAEVNVDGFAFQFRQVGGAAVRKDEMADIDVGADARMIALVNEAGHGVDAVEEAEAKGLELEGDVDAPGVGVIANAAASLEAPLPLGGGRNDFALPDVFAEDEQDVFGAPRGGEVDELLAALDVEIADGLVEIDEAGGDDREGNDGQVEFLGGAFDERDFFGGNGHGFGENIDGVEADAGDVLKARGRVDTDLLKSAVDDAQFHGKS